MAVPIQKSRFVLKVEQGIFAATLDTRLEAELLLALARQPDLEIVSAGVADRALRGQRICDPEREDFMTCRVRQLGIAGDFVVELEMGVVPGTWVLTTAITSAGGDLTWLPTLPFSQQRGESFEDAVVRSARLLGASLGPSGLRAGTRFPSARPIAGSFTELTSLCPQFNAPWSPLSAFAWQTRTALRAHLHRTDREAGLELALAELSELSKSGAAHCAQLAAVVAWQQRAVAQGWLPAEVESVTWRANIDIQLRAGATLTPRVVDDVGNSFAGAFANQGLTLHSIRPAAERCAEGPDCVAGIAASDVRPGVWVAVLDLAESEASLAVVGRLLVPNGEKVRAVPLTKIAVTRASPLKPAVDSAVADAIAHLR